MRSADFLLLVLKKPMHTKHPMSSQKTLSHLDPFANVCKSLRHSGVIHALGDTLIKLDA